MTKINTMSKYTPVIGLEIHVELKTHSKMFCACENAFGLESEPNVNICQVCTGQPGSLPVINEEAVNRVIKTALSLHCQINDFSKFDRKNYFYPDLPKGYQISQYDKPLAIDGYLEVGEKDQKSKINIRRIHLEEDTGKLMHPAGADYSLLDLNRAGLPLMELVTEPDINSATEAKDFCQELQLILRYLDVSDAEMEKGQMRCEVNISLQAVGAEKLSGTKVEVKNLNSFKAVERAIGYEIKRQTEALESGEKIIQETRGWSDDKQKTFSQRLKEEAHDYRYFPEPDLPPLTNLMAVGQRLAVDLPELPSHKRERFVSEYGLPMADVENFITDKQLADYFEEVVSELDEWLKDKKVDLGRDKLVKMAANYLINELPRVIEEAKLGVAYVLSDKISEENFAEFIMIIANGNISRVAAQIVLGEMFKTGIDPSHIIGDKDLTQMSDADELNGIIDKIIAGSPKVVEDYKKGKQNALQFLAGQVMKETRGRANPQTAQEMLKKKLIKN